MAFFLESFLDLLPGWQVPYLWFTIFIDSLYLWWIFILNPLRIWNLAVTHAYLYATQLTLSYCVCLGLYLAMRKDILGEWSRWWFMIFMIDRFLRLQFRWLLLSNNQLTSPSQARDLRLHWGIASYYHFYSFHLICCWTTHCFMHIRSWQLHSRLIIGPLLIFNYY